MNTLNKIGKFFLTINKAAFTLAMIVVIGMCLIMTFEVIMRYIFNRPTSWSNEYIGYLTLTVCFLGAAWVLHLKGHVSVDSLYLIFPKKVQHIVSIFSYIATFAYIGVMVWQGWIVTSEAFLTNVRSTSELNTPLFIPKAFIPIGALLLAIQIIGVIWEHIMALRENKE